MMKVKKSTYTIAMTNIVVKCSLTVIPIRSTLKTPMSVPHLDNVERLKQLLYRS